MKIFNEQTLIFPLEKPSSLLVNTLTGAIDIVPERIIKGEMNVSERTLLNNRGYFIEEKDDILVKLKEINQKHNQNIPYWFYVLTTLDCNFACPICYEKKILTKSEISQDVLDSIILRIKHMQKCLNVPSDRIKIVLFGGEPLLANPETIRRLLNLISINEWKVIIVTNGSLVPTFIELFEECYDVISDFRITLDGISNYHDKRRPYRGGNDSFYDVVESIDLLLEKGFEIKMQTILGDGNIDTIDGLAYFVMQKHWTDFPNFQWRIEGSHDYANLDIKKDEISEAIMVKKIIGMWRRNPALQSKIKFESFKYLAHLTDSFGWLGNYKTYQGPKFGFCEPQKGFHYVFSVDGMIYHCPRTINQDIFGHENLYRLRHNFKEQDILTKEQCKDCSINTLCGGGCIVQKHYYPKMDCHAHALGIISEFIDIMKEEIMKSTNPNQIVSINKTWI